MYKIFKLATVTACILTSTMVFAKNYKSEAPPLLPVSIPSFNGGFEFTLGALYLVPDSSNLTYISAFNATSPSIPGFVLNVIQSETTFAVDPTYKWGFSLGVGYIIPNTANNVSLDWTHFHNDYSGSAYLLGTTDFLTDTLFIYPVGAILPNNATDVNASATMDYGFDAIDLTFGQYVNFGSRLQTRVFTGLRYMRLTSDLSTLYTADTILNPTFPPFANLGRERWNGAINSSFNGLGPMVGMKANYYVGAGFGLTGAIDGTLLVGQVSMDADSERTVMTLTSGNWSTTIDDIRALDWETQNVIAPGFDAKLGANYQYQFNNGTALSLDVGYQVTNYWDVVEEIGIGVAGFSETAFNNSVTNFKMTGPYFSLNIKV